METGQAGRLGLDVQSFQLGYFQQQGAYGLVLFVELSWVTKLTLHNSLLFLQEQSSWGWSPQACLPDLSISCPLNFGPVHSSLL